MNSCAPEGWAIRASSEILEYDYSGNF
jgi:hypothetical protein